MSQAPEPTFDTIAIVGVGLIGGSLGLGLKRLGIVRSVVGVSRQETLEVAQRLGVIDVGYPYEGIGRAACTADIVFLCIPISRILELLPEVLAAVPEGCLVTDVGSTKAEIVARAASLRRDGIHFIGGHPMAGSERTGVSAADPFLFQNAIYVLTPSADVPEDVCSRLIHLVSVLGARALCLDPETHDRIAAAVSHLPQLMATALVGLIGRLGEADGLPLRMAAGGFRDMTRIASSPFDMWRDICRTNAGPIRDTIDRYLESLGELRKRVGDEDLEGDFEHANSVRSRIPVDSKGFLHPLHEILLVVKDRPGIIAGMAAALTEADINIDDIEVLKVREGEGGTIRMGFDTRETAERAISILQAVGYRARIR